MIANTAQRPFVNFYGPTFILYELSSPFLNIHWFCDKLNLTGTKIQFYNGIMLLVTFFSCRLVWGTYQSVRVFSDVYNALTYDPATIKDEPHSDLMGFAGVRAIPLWLPACYLLSNLTLNGLNWYWFGKMIETLRKRFDPPLGTRKPEKIPIPAKAPPMVNGTEDETVLVEGTDIQTPAALTPPESNDYINAVNVEREKSGHTLKVQQSEVRHRTSRRKG
jgi:hypothetical protein